MLIKIVSKSEEYEDDHLNHEYGNFAFLKHVLGSFNQVNWQAYFLEEKNMCTCWELIMLESTKWKIGVSSIHSSRIT